MVEKLLWIAVNTAASAASVIAREHREELDELTMELAGVAEEALKLKLDPGLCQRLVDYSGSVSHFMCSVKEFEWRNGWFVTLSVKQDTSPLHMQYLRALGFVN
eukprot:tig00021116_g18407.t1